jgi:hypothetical protein
LACIEDVLYIFDGIGDELNGLLLISENQLDCGVDTKGDLVSMVNVYCCVILLLLSSMRTVYIPSIRSVIDIEAKRAYTDVSAVVQCFSYLLLVHHHPVYDLLSDKSFFRASFLKSIVLPEAFAIDKVAEFRSCFLYHWITIVDVRIVSFALGV